MEIRRRSVSDVDFEGIANVILTDPKLFDYVMKMVSSRLTEKDNTQSHRRDWVLTVVDSCITRAFEDVGVAELVRHVLKDSRERSSHKSRHNSVSPQSGQAQSHYNNHRHGSSSSPGKKFSNDLIQQEVEKQKFEMQLKREQRLATTADERESHHELTRQQSFTRIPTVTQTAENDSMNHSSKPDDDMDQQSARLYHSVSDEAPDEIDVVVDVSEANGEDDVGSYDDDQDMQREDSINSHEDDNARSSLGVKQFDDESYDENDDMRPNFSFSEPEQVSFTDTRRRVRELNKQRVKDRSPASSSKLTIDVDEDKDLADPSKSLTESESSTVKMLVTPLEALSNGHTRHTEDSAPSKSRGRYRTDSDSASSQEQLVTTGDSLPITAVSSHSSRERETGLSKTVDLEDDEPVAEWERKVLAQLHADRSASPFAPLDVDAHDESHLEGRSQVSSHDRRSGLLSTDLDTRKDDVDEVLRASDYDVVIADDEQKDRTSDHTDSPKYMDDHEPVNSDEDDVYKPVLSSLDKDEFKFLHAINDDVVSEKSTSSVMQQRPLYFDQAQFDAEVDTLTAGKIPRRVCFRDNIVSEVFYREKTSPSEKTNMYYTHHEESDFCRAQSREYEKADAMGLTWLEYMTQREDSVAMEEDELNSIPDVDEDRYAYDDQFEDGDYEHDVHHYFNDDSHSPPHSDAARFHIHNAKNIDFSDDFEMESDNSHSSDDRDGF